MTPLLVVLGAVVGAPSRWLVDRAVQARFGTTFPWGTFTVNTTGSFVLGCVLAAGAAGASPRWTALLGTGFCGAFTTFSTFAYETMQLVDTRSELLATANVVVSVIAGTAMAFLGWGLVTAIT